MLWTAPLPKRGAQFNSGTWTWSLCNRWSIQASKCYKRSSTWLNFEFYSSNKVAIQALKTSFSIFFSSASFTSIQLIRLLRFPESLFELSLGFFLYLIPSPLQEFSLILSLTLSTTSLIDVVSNKTIHLI